MKAAVSIPDDLFKQSDRLARRMNTSRSRLYAMALAEFLDHHQEDTVTAAMNQTLEEVGEDVDRFAGSAASRMLRRVEW